MTLKENFRNHISFILDGKLVKVDFTDGTKPTTTVLNYLRGLPGHKGVKEGCAEGDCGACTVVIAEPEDGKMKYRTVNSCLLFLPAIDGKQLITVENLAVKNGRELKLHPVQQAMVEHHGSQCGYCTPGFIMSMFALYKTSEPVSEQLVDEYLTGNLCRCTGYRSIKDATLNACNNGSEDHFSETEKEIMETLNDLDVEKDFAVQTEKQVYFKPSSIEEALRLRQLYPNATLITGSTDIALKQTKKFELLPSIIELSGIRELSFILNGQETTEIGAGTPLEEIRRKIGPGLPAFREMLDVFASMQIRNVATLGGNIGTASPIGDALPLLMAYQASVKAIGPDGERVMKLEDFITGYRQNALAADELIRSVIIPHSKENNQIIFYKVSKRKDVDISTVSFGGSLIAENDKIKQVILAFGGVAETPKRAKATEDFLRGKPWQEETVEEAGNMLEREFTPISDARSGVEFRTITVRNLLQKFFNETRS